MMIADEYDIVRNAECVVVRAKLSMLEEEALFVLRDRPGLAREPLWPPSSVIQIVTLNGMHIGRVRLEATSYLPQRWVAVPRLPGKPHGPYQSARAAAESLVSKPSRRERI